MSTVFIAVAVLAGVACPLHMWWSHRRGRSGCLPIARRSEHELGAVRGGQQALERSIAEVAESRPREPRPSRQATQ